MNREMILVTGATGNVGGEVVATLAASGRPVRALVRDVARARFPANVEVAAGDLNLPESLGTALAGVRAVFLLGGYRDMPGALAEIRKAGAEHVVLLSSRSVIDGDPGNAIVRMWNDAEGAVRSSGTAWTLLRPSGFASNALRWAPQLRKGNGNLVRAPFANAAIASIDPLDIARVAVRALGAETHAGKAYVLSGPEAQKPAEQVRILGEVLGRELRFEAESDEDALAALRLNAPDGFADAFRQFFVEGRFDDSKIVTTVREITGREPRAFEEWARAHMKELSS